MIRFDLEKRRLENSLNNAIERYEEKVGPNPLSEELRNAIYMIMNGKTDLMFKKGLKKGEKRA